MDDHISCIYIYDICVDAIYVCMYAIVCPVFWCLDLGFEKKRCYAAMMLCTFCCCSHRSIHATSDPPQVLERVHSNEYSGHARIHLPAGLQFQGGKTEEFASPGSRFMKDISL